MSSPRKKPHLNGIWISDTAITQPVFVTMVMLALVVVGYLSFNTMPVNLLPEIEPPVVLVSVSYSGASPESVADQVAEPIEEALSTLNGVDTITTISSEGNFQAIVEFVQERDPVIALQEVREEVTRIRNRLPNDIDEPTFNRFDPAQSPILSMAVTSEEKDEEELRNLIDDEIVPRLQRVQGVGSITVNGGLVRQINVNMNLDRLTALRILPAQITNAIAQANTNQGLGDIGVAGVDVNLRTPSVIQQPEDIAVIGIPGTSYNVGDVATIEDGYEEIDTYTRLNGAQAINVDIRKQSGTNTVAVAEAVLEEIDRAFAAFPDLAYTIVRDDSEAVQENVRAALEEIVFAMLGAVIVLFIFLRNIRNTLTMVMGLPVIIIATFTALQLFDQTINILTLLALSISVGLVIDDAIVVRETIIRHIEKGEPPLVAASKGTAEVSMSVVAMSLTIIAVFVPVTFTTGTVGIIFGAFGITVAAAIAISMFEAFTLAPMISARLFKNTPKKHAAESALPDDDTIPDELREEVGPLARVYQGMLRLVLRMRLLTLAGGVAVVVLSIVFVAVGGLKFAFFPSSDQGEFGVGFTMPPGTPLDVTDELARQAEDILLADPAVEAVLTTVGGPGNAEHAEFFVKLSDETSTMEVQQRLRPQLAGFPDIALSIASFNGTSTDVTNRPLQAKILTTGDLEEIIPLAEEATARFKEIEGLEDVDMTYSPGKPEIRFLLNPARANDVGLSNSDLATTLRALIDGVTAASYRQGGEDYDIVVRLQQTDRANFEAIANLRVPLQGQMVPLANIASIDIATSPTSIRRENRQTTIVIGGNNFGRNINEVQAEMQAVLAELDKPPGAQIAFGGDTADQGEGFASLGIAMGLSVMFVYMVLASQFGSFLQPLVIMIAMPLSFIGAFLALSITQVELTIFGMVGMIMLMGLVVKNSILLVDFTNRLIDAGIEKTAAIVQASGVRLRPILMTSLTLIMGALPAAIGLGEGGETRRGLAVVIIGGMIASTLLTLLIVPPAYSLLESVTRRFNNLFRRVSGKQEPSTDAPAEAEAEADAPRPDEHPAPALAGNGQQPEPVYAAHAASTGNGAGNGLEGNGAHDARDERDDYAAERSGERRSE